MRKNFWSYPNNNLIVWDKENNRPLAKFKDCRFSTEDERTIKILEDLGIESHISLDPEIDEKGHKFFVCKVPGCGKDDFKTAGGLAGHVYQKHGLRMEEYVNYYVDNPEEPTQTGTQVGVETTPTEKEPVRISADRRPIEQPVAETQVKPEEMHWNDLQKYAKDLGLDIFKMNKKEVLAAIEAKNKEE